MAVFCLQFTSPLTVIVLCIFPTLRHQIGRAKPLGFAGNEFYIVEAITGYLDELSKQCVALLDHLRSGEPVLAVIGRTERRQSFPSKHSRVLRQQGFEQGWRCSWWLWPFDHLGEDSDAAGHPRAKLTESPDLCLPRSGLTPDRRAGFYLWLE
jgi:hypothetical protein